LVKFANLFQLLLESMVILQLASDGRDLLTAQTDVADFSSGVGHGQHRHWMSCAPLTLRTPLTMPDDPLQE
jgi:hypothetical protein